MVAIENIKQKIRQMEAGDFQNFCDAYLSKTGYPNIVSLGAEAGTRKTTKGTPDTYFYTSEEKYIFVEYTTQKTNLFAKIKEDIAKCLDTSKTGVTHNKISEIIYCHTSSNITPLQDNEVKTLCENAGIKLTVIGVDTLSENLYLFHHNIARDFLGISISTDQIQSCDDFIKCYNANRMAAPIDTQFLFRDKEIENINDAYQKVDIVILSGSAGTGKTRLALHYAKKHSDIYNEKLYCIHSNALPIYEDLKLFIDNPGNYFLFIDDANQLSGLRHIIRYTIMKPEGYNVRILITVRDYALQKVMNDAREIASYETVNINAFTDDEIKKLLETLLGIANQDYQARITRIAEGNARIAILAGKMACSSNRLDSIDDVSQLYDDYYSTYLQENRLLADNSLLITAGVIAFLDAIHLDYIDPLLPILQSKNINRAVFIESIYRLHELEIIDIYNDKVIRFSEQCLSNYLIKLVFFDNKLLSLSTMIKACFQSNKERTISSINTLLNIFRNKTLYQFIENEIKALWKELSQEKAIYFFEFVKAFSRINPTETLLILQDKIELEDSVIITGSDLDFEKGKNNISVTDDIIEILGGFADIIDLPSALDLFFQYYLKCPDLYIQFYHAANKYFGIKKDSMRCEFYTQITLFEKIEEYSDGWKQETVVILFIEIAKEFLKLHFSPMEGGQKHTITVYQIPLVASEGVEKYRKLIWQALRTLCEATKYKERIRKVLDSYGGTIEDISCPVLQFDLVYIKSILESAFPPSELQNCLLADRLVQIFDCMNVSYEALPSDYFEGVSFRLYHLLKGPDYKKEISFEEFGELKRQAIEQYVSSHDLATFKRLIDVCYDINGLNNHNAWEVREGLGIAFDTISQNSEVYIEAIEYYIQRGTPLDLHPYHLICNLFSLIPDLEVLNIINKYNYHQKNAWLYAYYHELPPELITEKHLHGLYSFLADISDGAITPSSYRDVDFLEKYSVIDKDVFTKGCKIILAKMEYSPFMAHIYFALLFNHLRNTPRAVVKKFSGSLELLEEIYCAIVSYDNHHDYNGEFLKEIYLIRSSILDKYISHSLEKDKGSFHNDNKRYRCFFELDNFREIFDRIFESIIQGSQSPTISVPYFLESLLLPIQNEQNLLEKQDEWIRHSIQLFSADTTKMHCLFLVIYKLSIDRKKEYVWLFLENNQSFEDFERIPLPPMSWVFSGSAVPMYSAWVEFLESLLPNFIGLKWIKHKKHVETAIGYLKQRIESEQIDEILRG